MPGASCFLRDGGDIFHTYSAYARGLDHTDFAYAFLDMTALGRPHVTPLVAVWAEGALHFCTGAEEQKFANLRVNPHVVLTTGCNRWDQGLDVVVEGDAVRVTDEDTLRRLAQAWATKWDGQWQFTVRDGCFQHEPGAAIVFSVTPSKVFAHAKGDPFGATTHRF